MPLPAATELPAEVEISLDQLIVRLNPRPDRVPKALDAPTIIAHLANLGVAIDRRGEAEVQEFCRPRRAGQTPASVAVATGTPSVDDVPPCIELIVTSAEAAGQARHVKANDPVATLVPRKSGRDGIDVLGTPIPRRQAEALPPIDASLTLAPDGRTYLATIDGVVRARGSGPGCTIAVLPCLRHAGPLNGKVIHSTGEIQIDGAVSGASIRAGGDIRVIGDMENSMAMCDGDFAAAALRFSKIEVAGNCTASSLLQSRVTCDRELIVEEGAIVGGHVIAAGGLRCRSLGSLEFTKTLIEIGIDPRLSERLATLGPEIESRFSKVQKIRQTVEPLLKSKQSVTPHQQLKLGALLAEADALDALAQNQRRELRQECEAALARCCNEVFISDIIYPGVTIRFPGVQTTARIALRGPCRICLETSNGQPCVVLLREGAPRTPLELCKLSEDWRAAAKHIAAQRG